jgi:hypothetical protein
LVEHLDDHSKFQLHSLFRSPTLDELIEVSQPSLSLCVGTG